MENNNRLRTKKGKPFFVTLLFSMIVITLLQLLGFISVLFFGGEFSYIRKYAYNNFTEQNINRKTYIENQLNQKTATVNSAGEEISGIISSTIKEKSLSSNALRLDKDLNSSIISESANILLSLLRQNMVNDVYMIIDSGELFNTDDEKRLSGIYIRDIDPSENDISNNEDLLMEIGNSELASKYGISLDYEWTAQLNADNSSGNLDFYYTTMSVAQNTDNPAIYKLGYWSGFSRISRSATESMKYTVPLISPDGEIYGVLGIGITNKLLQDMLPAITRYNNSTCYILGADFDNIDEYKALTYMGSFYSRLSPNTLRLSKEHRIEGDIYDFNYGGNVKTIGNIQPIKLYNSASPYKNQKWGVIAVGNEKSVMAIYNELIKMLIISSAVSFAVCLVISLIINGRITAPISKMIKILNKSDARSGEIVKFAPAGIKEIDMLGKAITRLQIDVRENASMVSKIIGMVDMGIGVFLYDLKNCSIYMSESLVKLLKFTELPDNKDVTIPFEVFQEYMKKVDKDNVICSNNMFSSLKEHDKSERADIEIMFNNSDSEKWLKFSMVSDSSNIIGLVQDITSSVLEKRRIEFERDYDITTGLLNRRAYLTRLDALFSNPDKLKTAAIIMNDLDNLKYVNDTYGHDFGDDYIRSAANVLKEFSNYGGIVSRLSGDEFNVFLYGFDSKDEIREIINKVRNKLAESYCLLADGSKYRLKASGGISWYPDDSRSYDTLMKYADFAMYTIKHTTKGNIAEFNESEYQKDSILITGVEEMNRIIDEQSVRFAFQAIISAVDGSVFGYEILMRPQSDILKGPLDFIRIARTSSKLYEIERLTWLNGISEFDALIQKGIISPDSKAFINSLSSCIISDKCIEYLEKNYPYLLKNIMMEMLESETENETYTTQKQKMIKRWGANIALDDFGTGYNNDFLFLKLEPDLIKIDRSIISGCDNDKNKKSIIKNLVKMAKNKDALVLAEGVETSGELKCVIKCGVDLIQGYYVTRPVFEPSPIKREIVSEIREFNGLIY